MTSTVRGAGSGLALYCILFAASLQAPPAVTADEAEKPPATESKSVLANHPGALRAGFLFGASLIGLDREFMVGGDRVGVQAGLGLVGVDAGVNFHFGHGAGSPYVSLGWWEMGLGDNSLGLVALNFGMRQKSFAGQLGVGFRNHASGSLGDFPEVGIITSLGGYWGR